MLCAAPLRHASKRLISTTQRRVTTAAQATSSTDTYESYNDTLPPAAGNTGARWQAIRQAQPFSDFLTDNHNRQHDYLRISLTERCNLRCLYCMPEDGVELSPSRDILTTPEIEYLSTLFVKQGVKKIRLTGGEPTVRKDILSLMRKIGDLRRNGLKELALTTNGISLYRKLDHMVESGLTGVNISLDTLDPFQYQILTRRQGFNTVMKSIERVKEMNRAGAGIKLKINCVVMRGFNDHQVLPFVEMTKNEDLEVRFIEYMPFGGNKWSKDKMMSYADMLAVIHEKYPTLTRMKDAKNDTSKTWHVPGFAGRVGFITSMTHNFCGTCNRLRITSDGNLKVCLHGNTEVSLRDMLRQSNAGEPMDEAAFEAIAQLEARTPTNDTQQQQLLEVIGAAVKRKKAKHAGMGLHFPPVGSQHNKISATQRYSLTLSDERRVHKRASLLAGSRSLAVPAYLLGRSPTSISQQRLYSTEAPFAFQSLSALIPEERLNKRDIEKLYGAALRQDMPTPKDSGVDHEAVFSPLDNASPVETAASTSTSLVQPRYINRLGKSRYGMLTLRFKPDEPVANDTTGITRHDESRPVHETGLEHNNAVVQVPHTPESQHSTSGARPAWGLIDEQVSPDADTTDNKEPSKKRPKVKRKQDGRSKVNSSSLLESASTESAASVTKTTTFDSKATTEQANAGSTLTHVNAKGEAHMVNISDKAVTRRVAIAMATVKFSTEEALNLIENNQSKKGDVLAIARVAGIMAAKRTSDLVPLCHPVALSSVTIDLAIHVNSLKITARVECSGNTGVEMEALTAASVTGLTVYDMCKAVDRKIVIQGNLVVYKVGGRSGLYCHRVWAQERTEQYFLERNLEVPPGVVFKKEQVAKQA